MHKKNMYMFFFANTLFISINNIVCKEKNDKI